MRYIYIIMCVMLSCISSSAQKAGDVINIKQTEVDKYFYATPIHDEVFQRMQGKSFPKNSTTKRSDLRYIKVLHINKDGKTQVGEMVCHKNISADLIDIFRKLYEAHYPIERMVLIDDYDADDERSMAANNTSCFNFRFVTGSHTKVSKHGMGMAVDLNPFDNTLPSFHSTRFSLGRKLENTERLPALRKIVRSHNLLTPPLVQSFVIELGMKGGGDDIALPCCHDMVFNSGENLDIGRQCLVDIGGANEGHGEVRGYALDFSFCIEAAQLPAVGVAAHIDVHGTQSSCAWFAVLLLCQKYKSGAGGENGQTPNDIAANRFHQTQFIEQSRLHSTLTAWQYKTVLRLLPVAELSYLKGVDAEPTEHLLMFYECPLQGKYCYPHLFTALCHEQFYFLFVDTYHSLTEVRREFCQ